MPLYAYKCSDCGKSFEVRHGMFFEDQRCKYCFSDDVFKITKLEYTGSPLKTTSTAKPGKIVDDYIKEARKEIDQEKKKIKREEM